ncbi:MAG TPA: hypothetical protein PK926_12770 [Spirochaetota bacterium]|nr:hypothetical protein [Spirochaetota bacterium]HPI89911.1 hypothetical protein [Spirochaetota bacterium]HPR49069.1 hypothetical protein [Spirochaetota bacterium]
MIIHKNFMSPQRDMNPYRGFLRKENTNSDKLFIRSKADQVEISEEAHKYYERNRVVELEKIRNRKIAREYYPLVRELIGRDGDLRNIIRIEKIKEIQDKTLTNNFLWDDNSILENAAESVINFL